MISIIFRNIILNAIKYNNKNGELNIQVAFKENKHRISMQDTGIGNRQG
ncbi:MAG: ATP-binding protein [Bacteroidota bacterium]